MQMGKDERDEDKAVAQIAEENSQEALDELYEHERQPDAPMLVIGDENAVGTTF